MGRLPGARLPRRRRDLHAVARPEAARPLLPGAGRPAPGRPPRALRPRRRGRHRPRRRARSSSRCCCASTRPRRGSRCWPRSRRRASSPGTCSRSATRTCARSRRASDGLDSRRSSDRAEPPIHLTPATRDRATAADWFERFEGAGLDGVVAKRLDAPYQPGKRAMLKIKHQRTADCVVAGFRWHKNGPGTHVGSLLLGLFDDEGTLHHVGVTSSFTWDKRAALDRGAGAAARERARGPSVARVGRVGDDRRRRRLRPAPAGRHLALEPRQGPVVGAAAHGARRRGRLRPPPGRPVPARDDVQALAPGQAAGGLPLRPARGDRAVPAGQHLR